MNAHNLGGNTPLHVCAINNQVCYLELNTSTTMDSLHFISHCSHIIHYFMMTGSVDTSYNGISALDHCLLSDFSGESCRLSKIEL